MSTRPLTRRLTLGVAAALTCVSCAGPESQPVFPVVKDQALRQSAPCAPDGSCPTGLKCVGFAQTEGDVRVCVAAQADVCAMLECPAEYGCLAHASSPLIYFCGRIFTP